MSGGYPPHLCPFCESGRDRIEQWGTGIREGSFTVFYRCKTKLIIEKNGAIYKPAWTLMCRPKDYA